MKILLFGKNGQLGWELQRSLAPLGQLICVDEFSKEYCGDFTNPSGIVQTVRATAPDIIVNAGAYTAVDKAESAIELVRTLNASAPKILANEAKQSGAWLIHYSTDYVFDGSGEQPWKETDATNPVNIYGKTKLEGDIAISESGCKHLIFRTSWVYGTHGDNFAKTMLRLAKERDTLNVIADQFGAPTGADLLADVTAHCIRHVLSNSDNFSGTYHVAASGVTSWYDYAKLVIESAEGTKLKPQAIQPIPATAYPVAAQRPYNSRLDTTKLRTTFALQLPDWKIGVARMLAEIGEKK